MLCTKIGWNWPSGFGEKDENGESLKTDGRKNRHTAGKTDDRRLKKLSSALSSVELTRKGWKSRPFEFDLVI